MLKGRLRRRKKNILVTEKGHRQAASRTEQSVMKGREL